MLKTSRKLAVLFAIASVLIVPAAVSAAPAPASKGGIAVSPGQLAFNLTDATASQTVPLTIRNDYNAPVSISAAFNGIDENAALLIPVDTLDPAFASALSISQTDITLPAHSSQVLTVQVTNVSALTAGGHYATLVLTQQDIQGHALSIKGAVSLTIFVVKNPGAYQSITLTGVSNNHWLFRLPTKVSLGFNNNGNVLSIPRATVLVFDHSGKVALQKGVANEASRPLLPGKDLQTTVKVSSIAHTWWPQKVQLEIAYRAQGVTQLGTATASFWYIPPIYLLVFAPPLWLVWRKFNKRFARRRPLPATLNRLPPLFMMRDVQSAIELNNQSKQTLRVSTYLYLAQLVKRGPLTPKKKPQTPLPKRRAKQAASSPARSPISKK